MDFFYPVPLQAAHYHEKLPSRLSTSYRLAIVNGQFQVAYLLLRGWGGLVVLVKLKTSFSSTATGLPTGTELGKKIIRASLDEKQSIMFFYLHNIRKSS